MTKSSFFSEYHSPIQEILKVGKLRLCLKREDLIHSGISGNKYWKLLHNIRGYLSQNIDNPIFITFGGAFSNHIAATAFVAHQHKIPVIGIIRGEELAHRWKENPTLTLAHRLGMQFHFVSREEYRDKETIANQYKRQFPSAKIIPEGGTNEDAVLGVKNMLNAHTEDFDYLCTAVGTGGTVAGLRKYALENQKVIGILAVEDNSIIHKVSDLCHHNDIQYFSSSPKGYGKINDELIIFINDFYRKYKIPLDPIYTGKMMMKLFQLIEQGFFEPDSKILAFHTGGIQGVSGANQLLEKKNKLIIDFNPLRV